MLAHNDAFARLFAIPDADLRSAPVEDLIIASRYRAAYRAARRLTLTDRESAAGPTSESVAVDADGGEFAVILGFARLNEDPPHLGTCIRDLTEDRNGLTPAARREALYERAEELAGFGTWELTDGRMLWSDNLFRIFGLRPGEVTPSVEYVLAHCHPDDREHVEHVRDEVDRTGRRRNLRFRYIWPDGTVRHLTSTVVVAANADEPSGMLVGTLQDLTDHHQAELELAARFAVSDALSGWEPGAMGARRLVKDLAEALEFDFGMMWIPRGDVLAPWVIWQARTVHSPQREADLHKVRLARGDGLVGSAWALGLPTRLPDLPDDAVHTVQELHGRTGIHGSLAVPATYGDEVLAVLGFGSRRQAVLTDRFMRSLLGIGYEIGHFLARRRSELSASVLTPRELEVLQLSGDRVRAATDRRRNRTERSDGQDALRAHLQQARGLRPRVGGRGGAPPGPHPLVKLRWGPTRRLP